MARAKKTTKKTAKKTGAKAKATPVDPMQQDIPGARVTYPEVEEAAVDFAKAEAAAARAGEKKASAKALLVQRMHAREITEYRMSDGRLAKLSPREDGVVVKAYKKD